MKQVTCGKCGGRHDSACYVPGKGRDPDCPLWPVKGYDKNGYRIEPKQ